MKKSISIKQTMSIGLNIIMMLFLYLVGVERIIKAPIVIAALSRWGLLIFPFFQKTKANNCNCSNTNKN